MVTPSSPVQNHINLTFAWTGSNQFYGGLERGGFDVRFIDLIFRDAPTQWKVVLPGKSWTDTDKYVFTNTSLETETFAKSLSVSIASIISLVINARFLRKNPAFHVSTAQLSFQPFALRSDQIVALSIPEQLEIGGSYCLEMISNSSSLTARIIKELKEEKRRN